MKRSLDAYPTHYPRHILEQAAIAELDRHPSTVAPTRLRLSAGGVPGVLAEEACRQQCRAWILAARTSGWGRTFARTLDDLVRTLHRKD